MNKLRKHATLLIVVVIAIAIVLMVWSRKVTATDGATTLQPGVGESLPALTSAPGR